MSESIIRKISSIDKLKELSINGLDCFIHLNGGLKSSKNIYYKDEKFEVFNEIDGHTQTLSEEQLEVETNIVTAIKQGCLYYEDPFLTKSEKMKQNKERLIKRVITELTGKDDEYSKSLIRKLMREALLRKTQGTLNKILKTD